MIEWIDVCSLEAPTHEGAVIAFYPNPSEMGSGSAVSAWRTEIGGFICEWAGEALPSHFFYLPPEPQIAPN